jgi:hypothetical protein
MPPPDTIYVFKAVCPKVSHYFQHRLIDTFCVRAVKAWMLSCAHPVLYDCVEFIGGHVGVRSHYELDNPAFPRRCEFLAVAVENCFKGLSLLPFRMPQRQRFYAIHRESDLGVHRLFHHGVPSLSNAAIRSLRGTNVGAPS